jgi:proteasome alpha subunit
VTEFLEKSYKNNVSMEEAGALAIESIYLVSEDKTGTRHVKMAIIDNNTKTMRKVEEDEIDKYASMVKEGAEKRTS